MSRPPLLDETNLSSEQKLIFDNIRSGPLRTGNHYGWRLLEIRFEWHVHAPIAARYGVTTDVIAYEEGCKQSGRPVDFNNWCVAKSIFVAKNEATARNYARGAGSPYVHYFSSHFSKTRQEWPLEPVQGRPGHAGFRLEARYGHGSLCDPWIAQTSCGKNPGVS